MTQVKYPQHQIDEYRDVNVDYEWWGAVYEDFGRVCDILGVRLARGEPQFSGFCSQGDGASWAGSYKAIGWTARPGGNGGKHYERTLFYETAPARLRSEYPKDTVLHEIADKLQFLGAFHGPMDVRVARYTHVHYAHSHTMYVDLMQSVDPDTGDTDDLDPDMFPDALYRHIEEEFLTQFRALADWLYDYLEAEYEYLTSDEAIVDWLEANDIEPECDDEDEAA